MNSAFTIFMLSILVAQIVMHYTGINMFETLQFIFSCIAEIIIMLVFFVALRIIYLQLRGSPDAVVDINEMIKHALTFFLYLFSQMIYLYANAWGFFITNVGFLAVSIFWIVCYLTAQMLLTSILFKLSYELVDAELSDYDDYIGGSRTVVGQIIPKSKLFAYEKRESVK